MNIDQILGIPRNKRRKLIEDISIKDIIEKSLDLRRDRQGENVRPSTIGTGSGKALHYNVGCIRALWFDYYGYPQEPPSERSKRRMAVGKAYHLLMESLLEQAQKAGIVRAIENEKELWLNYKGLTISHGFSDSIVTVGDKKIVVEFKTAETLPSQPKDEHLTQAHIYMKALDIGLGSLVYIGIGPDLQMVEFPFYWDPHRWAAIESKLDKLLEYINSADMPPKEGSYKYCNSWCPYRKICGGER